MADEFDQDEWLAHEEEIEAEAAGAANRAAANRGNDRRRDSDRGDAARSRDPSPAADARAREEAAREEAAREEAAREARKQMIRQKIERVLLAAHSFEVLELPVVETSAADVDKAYKKLSKLVHPDKVDQVGLSDYKGKATKAFKKLGEAKEELSDADKQKRLIDKIEAEEAAEAARQAALEELSPWQAYIEEKISRPTADDRELLYVKGSGGAGMTWMTRHVMEKYGDRVLVVNYSSARHALFAVCEEQERLNAMGESAIIILDIPRSAKIDHEFYIAAETIKGAIFQSPLKPVKSKTVQCKLDLSPCVLVFSNLKLVKKDLENLTADRWDIMSIDPDSNEAVQLKQAQRWVDEITEERYKEARQEIDDDMALGDDPNEQKVRDCFEVDSDATDELVVQKDLHPVIQAAGYDKNHICLGVLLARVFKKEMKDGTVRRKQHGKKGTRYIGLKIKADAPQPA